MHELAEDCGSKEHISSLEMVSECILVPKLYYKITFLFENTRNVRHVFVFADGNLSHVTWAQANAKKMGRQNVGISQSERPNCEIPTFFQVDQRRICTFSDETGLK